MKKTTLAEVAKAAGVSLGTASRVINGTGYTSAESKEAVWNAIRQTGYECKTRPAAVRQERKLIVVLLKKLPDNLFFESMNYAFLAEAEKNGIRALSVFCEHVDSETIAAQIASLEGYPICGIAVCGYEEPRLSDEFRSLLLGLSIPVVFVERIADSHGFNQIYIDNFLGGYLGARHLIEKGHRKIVYIGRKALDMDRGSRRLEGFLKAFSDLSDPPEYLIKLCPTPDRAEGYKAMQEAMEEFPGFTAVQLWYDGYAIGAMQYLHDQGLRVPEDIELMGHDNTYSPLLAPPISSIQLPFEEIARQTVSLILDWQGDSIKHYVRTINLEPTLIVRENV